MSDKKSKRNLKSLLSKAAQLFADKKKKAQLFKTDEPHQEEKNQQKKGLLDLLPLSKRTE